MPAFQQLKRELSMTPRADAIVLARYMQIVPE